jgi:hypothetical protein
LKLLLLLLQPLLLLKLLLLLQLLLLLTLRSNLLHEEKKPLKSGFFIFSKKANYLESCSVNKVNNCNPAGVFSGLPSAFCTYTLTEFSPVLFKTTWYFLAFKLESSLLLNKFVKKPLVSPKSLGLT